MRATFLALLILTSLSTAQQPRSADPASPSEAESKYASLEGKLIDASTGEPVRKANLVVMQIPVAGGVVITGPPPSTAASSDAEGKFSFPKLEPGRYILSAEKAGYVRQQYGTRAGQFGPATNLMLESGQKVAGIKFSLMPQAVIIGKVVDEDGEPVPHSMITVLRRTPLARRSMGVMGMPPNDVGEFRIPGLAPGRYTIRAEQRGPMFGAASPAVPDAKGEGTMGYVPTYYPGVTDEASAGEITVSAGQQLSGMDIRLRKGRVFEVSGRIQGVPGGSSPIQVSLQAVRSSGGGMVFGMGGGGNVKPDGTFTIPSVTPGSWDVVAMSLESGRPQMLGRAPVTVTNANVKNVVLQAGSLLELTGRVIQESEPGVSASDKAGVAGQVILQPLQAIPMFIPPARIQDDGTFKLAGVSREQFRVDVIGLSGDQYVRAVRAGNVDVTTSGLDLTAAETAPPIEIRVSPKGAAVSGVVLDGDKPSPGAVVVALMQPFRADRRSAMQKTASTDQNGRFTLQGLTPGEYRIYAWDSYVPLNDLDEESLKPFEKLSAAVKLREAAREQVELKLAAVARE